MTASRFVCFSFFSFFHFLSFSFVLFRSQQQKIQKLALETKVALADVQNAVERIQLIKEQQGKMEKFLDASWRFFIYTTSMVSLYSYSLFHLFLILSLSLSTHTQTVGIYVVHDKPWKWETGKMWEDYPMQENGKELILYSMFGLGLYIHQLLFQFTDVQRGHSDFWPMLIHHLSTIILIGGAYLGNFVRVICLIMSLHDISDVFLEGAKVLNYGSTAHAEDIKERGLKLEEHPSLCEFLSNVMFGLFASSFFLMRLVYFPAVVLQATMAVKDHVGAYSGADILNGCLVVLQILHVYWFYLISIVAFKIFKGGSATDIREEEEGEGEEGKKQK